MAVENVSPGQEVWSRDEQTGVEAWRPVVATFQTHLTEIYTLRYDTNRDGVADEELKGTGPHPFWVAERNEFVPLAELKLGDTLYIAGGKSAAVTALCCERAPPGQAFIAHNFEVAGFHTYFVGEAGVWVHNFSTRFCDDFLSISLEVKQRLGIANVKGKRFQILEESFKEITKSNKVIDSTTGNHFMHVTQLEEFAEYTGELASIASVRKLRNLKIQKGAAGSWDAGGFEIHHTSEKWLSKRLGIADDILDECPGIPLRKNPDAKFDAAYRGKYGRDPIYHGGTAANNGLAARLNQIKARFDSGEIPDEAGLLQEVKSLYNSPPYDTANMWSVTRDWLKQHISDPTIVPN